MNLMLRNVLRKPRREEVEKSRSGDVPRRHISKLIGSEVQLHTAASGGLAQARQRSYLIR